MANSIEDKLLELGYMSPETRVMLLCAHQFKMGYLIKRHPDIEMGVVEKGLRCDICKLPKDVWEAVSKYD